MWAVRDIGAGTTSQRGASWPTCWGSAISQPRPGRNRAVVELVLRPSRVPHHHPDARGPGGRSGAHVACQTLLTVDIDAVWSKSTDKIAPGNVAAAAICTDRRARSCPWSAGLLRPTGSEGNCSRTNAVSRSYERVHVQAHLCIALNRLVTDPLSGPSGRRRLL